MVVNKSKTKILCISNAQAYSAFLYLQDSDGNTIRSGKGLKVLGFDLDGRPSKHAHAEALKVWMRNTTLILRHLWIAGFSEPKLATM